MVQPGLNWDLCGVGHLHWCLRLKRGDLAGRLAWNPREWMLGWLARPVTE